jgi:hypothetical protein
VPPLDLLPGAHLRLDNLVLTPTTAFALLVSTASTAVCPQCQTASDRIHRASSGERPFVGASAAHLRGTTLRHCIGLVPKVPPALESRFGCRKEAGRD